jgi:hypothetical protein
MFTAFGSKRLPLFASLTDRSVQFVCYSLECVRDCRLPAEVGENSAQRAVEVCYPCRPDYRYPVRNNPEERCSQFEHISRYTRGKQANRVQPYNI